MASLPSGAAPESRNTTGTGPDSTPLGDAVSSFSETGINTGEPGSTLSKKVELGAVSIGDGTFSARITQEGRDVYVQLIHNPTKDGMRAWNLNGRDQGFERIESFGHVFRVQHSSGMLEIAVQAKG